MNKPQKTKLCWNCEGSVSRTIENCPYCGVYLSPEASDIKEEQKPALSKPPYTPKNNKKSDIPKAPYAPQEAISTPENTTLVAPSSLQTVFLPLFLLSAGAIALFFAFILMLFATNGKLTLQWDGEQWYLYALAAIPLLAAGWFTLNHFNKD